MKALEIYYCDLTPTVQAKVLALNRISSSNEANWEFVPIFVLEEPEFDEKDDTADELE